MTTYTGTWSLARAALRRDRVLASAWVLLLVVVVYASAAATESLYPTAADRVDAAEAINNSPAIVALYGPILDVTSLGELAMTKLTVLYAVFAALLFLVLVRRHTRTEEESGRAELLGGTAIGRDAPLAAAVARGGAGRARARRPRGRGVGRCRAPGRRVRRLRCVLGRRLVGRDRADRGGLPGLGERPHVRRGGRRRSRLPLRPPHHRRHRPGLGVVALAVRLVDAAARVVRPALVGAAAVPRPRRRCSSSPPSGCGSVATSAPGWWPPGPGPAEGSPRLADAFVLTWRTHRTMLLVLDRRRRCAGAGDGRDRAERRRPARHRGRPPGDREHRRGRPDAGRPGGRGPLDRRRRSSRASRSRS